MLLSISIGIAIIYVLLKPMSDGLMNTSMWVSKMLAPNHIEDGETSKQMLKVGQAALMDGWLSNIPFLASIFLFGGIIVACFVKWWFGIIAFLFMVIVGAVASLIFIRSVSFYLSLISHRMSNRSADYKKKQDWERYEASESYNKDLMEITTIYYNSRLKPPTEKELKKMPYGDLYYWLNEKTSN